jgi:hypothetical protein
MTETSLSKWEQAINKLIELTQDGKIEWQVVNPRKYLPNGDVNGPMLIIKYVEKHLLLCRKAYMRSAGSIIAVFSGAPTEVKDYRPELSVYDMSSQEIIYTFPYSELVNDLFKAATYNAAKVDELISNILGELPKENTNEGMKNDK